MEELKLGQRFIGKLENEYKGEIIEINKDMLQNDERIIHFLHYFGFEIIKEDSILK